MVEGKRVAVVVPAYEEEHLVAETLRGIPDFVDRIYVVDDASPDETAARARAVADPRVEVIVHEQNGGVGAAIVTGYLRAREERIDVTCVMAADNQMDPDELASLVGPVARGEVDYAKANRLITGEAWTLIPHTRYLGNAVLSLLTKIASGYWHVADSQAGLHGALARGARPARPRAHLPPLRLPERHARAPERRLARACATCPRGRSTASASAPGSRSATSRRGSRGCCSRASGGG